MCNNMTDSTPGVRRVSLPSGYEVDMAVEDCLARHLPYVDAYIESFH